MIINGKQLFLNVLKNHSKKMKSVYLAKECDKKLFSQIAKLNIPIIRADAKKAQALAKGGNHQGVIAEIEPIEFTPFEKVKNGNFMVMLYGLTDVGNIGAICRSAYVFGADALIIAGIKQINLANILRTSSGAAFELPIVLTPDGLSALNELKHSGFTSYAASMNGKDVKQIKFTEKKVLVLGNEGEGIPQKALQRCDETISIKMARAFDSLNVSAAAAVLCDRIANE